MSPRTKALLGVILLGTLATTTARGEDSERLLPPWTPVTLQREATGVEVGVWGRKMRLANSPLPASIVAAGEELLAAPIRLAGSVDGKPIEWQRSGILVLTHDESRATLCGWQANASLIVNMAIRVEFDGMMRIDTVVLPQRGAKPRLDQLWLEVPLKASGAGLFHFWPGRWGTAMNSGGVADSSLTLPFKPLVWLGSEERGLAWFAESDKGWQPKKPNEAIEVIRQGDQTLLRLRLLDSPPPRLPVTFTFGLQATPVKPMPNDFHEWRIWHAAAMNTMATKLAHEVFPNGWHTAHRAFGDGNPLPALDRAAQLGVKTVVLHEDWAPLESHWLTSEPAEIQRIVTGCHDRKMKVLVYFGYELSALAPEFAEMADQVLLKNSKGDVTPGWHRLPEQRDFRVCYHSRWQDLLLEGMAKLLDKPGVDGFYLDGTITPDGCCNQVHGCGYVTPDGKLRPTYPIFAVRRMMQRMYAMVHARGGLINAHQSTCCLPATLAFVDSYWDGEQFSSGELSSNLLEKLPLAAFRAEFMGRNFGVPCEFLAYEKPPHWTFDHALTLAMLHDVRVRPHGPGVLLEKMSAIWDVMSRFGVSQSQWHPYWNSASVLTAGPEPVKASLYSRKAKGSQPGRTLLVVANLSAEETKTAQLRLDTTRLGLRAGAVAEDALTHERFPLQQGSLTVSVPPVRMRLVWVE